MTVLIILGLFMILILIFNDSEWNVLFAIILVIVIIMFVEESKEEAYKQGQINVLSNKSKYKPIIKQDTTWTEIKQP